MTASAKKKLRPQNRGTDTPLLAVTLVLVVFGLIMMYSASFANAYYLMGSGVYYIRTQIVFAAIGVAGMLAVSRIDYHILKKFAWPLYAVSVAMLIVTLFMPPINNAKRWIIIGSQTFQPSEIAKFAVINLFAFLASRHPERMKQVKYGYLRFMLLLAVVAVIMLQQPHLSGTVLILIIGMVLMFIGGTDFRWFALTGAVAVPAGLAFVLLTNKMSYAASRVEMWLDPFKDPSADGYQTVQSLIAIGSGGLFGLGLGNSRQKHLYVPEPQNDFVFSIICEELGFIGAVFVISLFVLFIFRGFAIALKSRDRFGVLLTVGVTIQVGIQALFNIAVVSNTIPNTGISLPFFSQGGTSLVILLLEVGVMLSVARFSQQTTLEGT